MTLMYLAAYYDHDEAIPLLFKLGCTSNVPKASGCTPLQVACVASALKQLKLFLSLPAINPLRLQVVNEQTLMSAVHKGNLDCQRFQSAYQLL